MPRAAAASACDGFVAAGFSFTSHFVLTGRIKEFEMKPTTRKPARYTWCGHRLGAIDPGLDLRVTYVADDQRPDDAPVDQAVSKRP